MASNILQLHNIDVEDLHYLEQDLNLSELVKAYSENFIKRLLIIYAKVSIGFLLFGAERPNAEYVLQKLLILWNTQHSIEEERAIRTGTLVSSSSDLLRKYASLNPRGWRTHIVEALAIIGARRVLRKMGCNWESVRQQYLPHIAEFSLYVHPLLKALYKMCERMKSDQAAHFVLQVNEQQQESSEHLRFYDYDYLEFFLLDWITRRLISLGDAQANGANLQVLIDYLKLNEMDSLKMLLMGTINHNAERPLPAVELPINPKVSTEVRGAPDKLMSIPTDTALISQKAKRNEFVKNDSLTNGNTPQRQDIVLTTRVCTLNSHECYTVTREKAGFVVIINQKNFHNEPAEELKHLLPRKPFGPQRLGTDQDHLKLRTVFTSFGYKIEEFTDLTHIQMQHNIREAVKRSLLYDSLIVCILSHGIEGAVYGCNSIPVDIAAIERIITDDTLLGKPKMLIIQACQEYKDEQEKSPPTERKRKPLPTSNKPPDGYGDMIKAISTVPGYVSIRHTKTGGWFIQSLCNKIDELGDSKHMLDILISVNHDVATKCGNETAKMVPITSNTLKKFFFLPSRKL